MTGVHENSVESNKLFDKEAREALVVHIYESARGTPLTDRQVLQRTGQEDMNYVRPSITGLIERGLAQEVGKALCPVTKRRVRLVRLANVPVSIRTSVDLDLEGPVDRDAVKSIATAILRLAVEEFASSNPSVVATFKVGDSKPEKVHIKI
jgi:hypothetical protein